MWSIVPFKSFMSIIVPYFKSILMYEKPFEKSKFWKRCKLTWIKENQIQCATTNQHTETLTVFNVLCVMCFYHTSRWHTDTLTVCYVKAQITFIDLGTGVHIISLIIEYPTDLTLIFFFILESCLNSNLR